MFGLLGPNGAGKSTLMRTIATLQAPDSGAITFGGIDVLREKTELRKVLGYLPQEFGSYPRTSAQDHAAPFRRAERAARPAAAQPRWSSCWSGPISGTPASAASTAFPAA